MYHLAVLRLMCPGSITLLMVALSACTGAMSASSEALVCGTPDDELSNLHDIADVSGCTVYRGSIHVGDSPWVDLSTFSELREIEGRFTFFRNESLTSLRGLEKLETVGGRFALHIHEALSDVGALSSLRSIGGELFLNDLPLVSVTGFENLRSVGSLRLSSLSELTSLSGLSGLESVNGDLTIVDNRQLHQDDAEAFVAGLDVAGQIDVSGNKPR